MSRQHLRLFRQPDGSACVEDLETRNGTTLAGARITGPLPVGAGLEIELAGQIRCSIAPCDGGALEVRIATERCVVPLGPWHLGDWLLSDAHDGDDRFVVVRTPDGAEPPYLGTYRLARQIELCVGDALCRERDGAVFLRALQSTEW